ncbi:MAG: ATP-binding protein [Lewinellaceae bacterium]|nr:ATP-binding protein [Lewinellaceae bacterium]
MQGLIGREKEIQILEDVLASSYAELVALYGRRRVGKTFLVRTVYEKQIVFELTGLKDASLAGQLENFTSTLAASLYTSVPLTPPKSWFQAFRMLITALEARPSKKKRVVFLDEFPWLDTPKSGFLSAFDHFWNNWASRQSNLIVVICGSAASWMIQNIVRNKGGLHNRLTRRIRLLPFNLCETERFLNAQRVILDRYQILQLFMATGGIPHYLKGIRPGESAAQAIDRLCFTNDGLLRDEFQNLYPALFNHSEKHIGIVRALAGKPSGLTRKEIIETCGFPSGGTLTKTMEELLESGFIMGYTPFQKASRDTVFKLADEYSLFYLKFIENSRATGEGAWLTRSAGASWKSWSGLAFENICLKHIRQIKKALGISGIYSEESIWRYHPSKGEEGVQVDLLIDRNDNCINLVEIKFSAQPFVIDKKYAADLQTKRQVFLEKSGTRKSAFVTMLTTFGVKNNEHYPGTVQNQLKMDALFEVA